MKKLIYILMIFMLSGCIPYINDQGKFCNAPLIATTDAFYCYPSDPDYKQFYKPEGASKEQIINDLKRCGAPVDEDGDYAAVLSDKAIAEGLDDASPIGDAYYIKQVSDCMKKKGYIEPGE